MLQDKQTCPLAPKAHRPVRIGARPSRVAAVLCQIRPRALHRPLLMEETRLTSHLKGVAMRKETQSHLLWGCCLARGGLLEGIRLILHPVATKLLHVL